MDINTKIIGYQLYNTLYEVYSKGAVENDWRMGSDTKRKAVRVSRKDGKVFKSLDAVKAHLLKIALAGISMDGWVVQPICIVNEYPLSDLYTQNMLFQVMKKTALEAK